MPHCFPELYTLHSPISIAAIQKHLRNRPKHFSGIYRVCDMSIPASAAFSQSSLKAFAVIARIGPTNKNSSFFFRCAQQRVRIHSDLYNKFSILAPKSGILYQFSLRRIRRHILHQLQRPILEQRLKKLHLLPGVRGIHIIDWMCS